MKYIIEVEIENISVDPEGYFSFDYLITVNGKRRKKESYDSDFDSQTPKEMEKTLKNGYALELALQDFS